MLLTKLSLAGNPLIIPGQGLFGYSDIPAGDSKIANLFNSVSFGIGRRNVPSITYKITPAGSLSSSQPGGPPCRANYLAFGHIGHNK
jgi:hypothetical protein